MKRVKPGFVQKLHSDF